MPLLHAICFDQYVIQPSQSAYIKTTPILVLHVKQAVSVQSNICFDFNQTRTITAIDHITTTHTKHGLRCTLMQNKNQTLNNHDNGGLTKNATNS